MSPSTSFRIFPAVLVGLTLSCGDSAGPGDAAGLYVLRQVEQDPLPTVLYQNEFFITRVLSDTIRLVGDGRGIIRGVREAVPVQPGGDGQELFPIVTNLRFRLAGSQIEIDFECPPWADCIPPPHLVGQLRPDGLTLRWGPSLSGRSPLIYAQVAP
jgi:hypothetical protein